MAASLGKASRLVFLAPIRECVAGGLVEVSWRQGIEPKRNDVASSWQLDAAEQKVHAQDRHRLIVDRASHPG